MSIRRRFVAVLLAAASVLVVSVALPRLARGGVVTPVSIDDNFTGKSIDYSNVGPPTKTMRSLSRRE